MIIDFGKIVALMEAAQAYRKAHILHGAGFSGADHMVSATEAQLDAALRAMGVKIDVNEVVAAHEAQAA